MECPSCVFAAVRSPRSFCHRAGVAGAQQAELPLKHAPQPTTPAIARADLMTRLYIFADDSMMGREVGTRVQPQGQRRTSSARSRRIGLTARGDSGTFFQNLPVFEHALARNGSITVDGKAFAPKVDYMPRDNSLFGGAVRSIDGAQVVYGGMFAPPGDPNQMISPAAPRAKSS